MNPKISIDPGSLQSSELESQVAEGNTPNTLSTDPKPVNSRITSELKLWYFLENSALRNTRNVFC
jgi:hypothetical protein